MPSAREASPPQLTKSVELEHRLGRLELCCEQISEMLTTLRQQIVALQAQIDYVDAKMNRS